MAVEPMNNTRRGLGPARWLVLLAVLALLAALGTSVGLYYARRAQSRAVLAQASALRVAAYAEALDAMAEGRRLSDPTAPYGFVAGTEQRILDNAGATGEIWLLRTDSSGRNILEFLYVQDGYAVHCTDGGQKPDDFSVYRLEEE